MSLHFMAWFIGARSKSSDCEISRGRPSLRWQLAFLLASLPRCTECRLHAFSSSAQDQRRQGRIGEARLVALSHEAATACSLVTGGNCYIFGCEDSRGGAGKVDCVKGYCLCKPGFCSLQGTCVIAPATGDEDKWIETVAPIHLLAHPDKCLDASAKVVKVQECGSDPEKFALPVGGIGMIRREANRSQCLGVVLDPVAGASERIEVKECSVVAGAIMQFVLPAGALGPVRWNYNPAKCLAVVVAPVLPSNMAPGAPQQVATSPTIVGSTLGIQQCLDGSLLEQFGLSDEAPAPFQPCNSSASCAQMKSDAVLNYCSENPSMPNCEQFRQCPPGGCNNGVCVSGYCQCNSGYTGESCEQIVEGAVPISSGASSSSSSMLQRQRQTRGFMPKVSGLAAAGAVPT